MRLHLFAIRPSGAPARLGRRTVDVPGELRLPDGTTWVPCEEPGVLPQLEGVAVDQRNGALYAAQQDVGVWRIQLPLGSRRPQLIDRVADFGIHDVFDEESEECVPVDEDATGFGGPNLVADADGLDVTNLSYVDWADIAKALHLQVSTDKRNDPRFR